MGDVRHDLESAPIMDRLAAVSEARILFGSAAARNLWSDLGLPVIEPGERKTANPSVLRDRIIKLASGPTGMTIGVIINRCRAFDREAVERETASLVESGVLRAEKSIGGNGKTVERFIAN